MSTAADALQRAIFSVLSANTAVMASVTGIYDHVPDGTALPYIVIAQGDSVDASTSTTQAVRLSLNLVIFSQASGRAQALDILAKLQTSLASPLTLNNGWRCAYLRAENANVQARDNDRLRQITMPMVAWVEKISS
ncbi:MAG: DUF3168 domain-containing protein [Rickettsiales bacterium]|nr:DUF3168 domain-containing protein [Rickettsiales bacterium]